MIQLNNISFSYTEELRVLNDISFSLEKGETIGIVGASGCGKSTLLRIISSLLPSSEEHNLDGKIQIKGLSPNKYRKTGKLSFMFQEATLMPNLTVKKNINFPQQIRGIKDGNKTSDLLKTVGLEKFADYFPKQLSGGMKTRVALARSFITEPELLLLDEPFSALDIAWKSKLYNELEDLKNRYQSTVILVTHDIQEALLLCDKIIVLKSNGKIMGKEVIQSKMPVEERVSNVSDYLKEVYSRHYIPIQKLIMDDGVRSRTTWEEADNILDHILSIAGNKNEEQNLSSELVKEIRDFTQTEDVNNKLIRAYSKAVTKEFKYKLMWDILNYPNLSQKFHQDFFDLYLENIKEFSTKSTNHYKREKENIFDSIINLKLNDSDIPSTKKWIYLCDLYASPETERVIKYLESVITGKVEELNQKFIKDVARKIKYIIINEKVDSIHIQ